MSLWQWRTALLLAAALAWPTLANAQAQAPNERLLIELPAGWKVGYTAGEAGRFNTVEYVLETETIATWTRLLTIQLFYNATTPIDRYMELMKANFDQQQPCTNTTFTLMRTRQVYGLDAAIAMLVCPSNKNSGLGELTLIQAVRGKEAIYVVQRAMRGPAYTPAAVPISTAEFQDWLTFMDKLWVCDPREAMRRCPQL
jgi:hypothetical protein